MPIVAPPPTDRDSDLPDVADDGDKVPVLRMLDDEQKPIAAFAARCRLSTVANRPTVHCWAIAWGGCSYFTAVAGFASV